MTISPLIKSTAATPVGSLSEIMKQQLFWLLLLRIVLYTLLLGINLLLLNKRFDVIALPPSLLVLFSLGVYLVTIGSAFLLHRSHGEYRRFGFIQTILDTVFATLLVYYSGCSQSMFSAVYFFPIISGGLLNPIKGGLIGAAASSLLYAFILVLEYYSILPDYMLFSGMFDTHSLFNLINHFATKGLSFFLAAVISALFSARLKSTADALTNAKYDYDRLHQLYKQIFENISTGIITIDGNMTITSANNAMIGITGLPATDIVGRPLNSILPNIDLTTDSQRNACDFERADKMKLRLGYTHANVQHPQKKGALAKLMAPEDQVSIITLKDIGEIERLESQMRQAEKLAAIGMMSAGIAHDFRNPLTAISGSAQILAHEFASRGAADSQNYELSKIILRESDRLTKTIADFLRFARPDRVDRDWFLLKPCVEEILEVCSADPKWPGSCTVEVDIDPLFRVWADEKQLFTVINHFLTNGLAFCPKGRERLRIVSDRQSIADRGMMSSISVEDSGKGVDPANLETIFEPFYTTRLDGTGLGLAIARQTAEAHGGFIAVGRSDLGGASFTIYLPLPESDQTPV